MARHGYRGDGAFGQFCIVLPDYDAVVATTAGTLEMQAVLDAVWRHILPALDRDPIDSAAQNKLALRLGDLHLQAYEMAPQPVDWGAWSLAVFAVTSAGGDTALQSSLTALRVQPGPAGLQLTLKETDNTLTFDVGTRGWATSTPVDGFAQRIPL